MAPIDTTAPPHAAVDMEMEMEIPVKSSAPPPKYKANYTGTDGVKDRGVVEIALRASLVAAALAAVIVMVTCKQTKLIPISPVMAIPLDANFNQSPAYIYFVAALSVACLYGIITCASSYLALKKPEGSTTNTKLQFHFMILDSLLFGIVASAAGAAAGVAYVGLKGNSHSRWKEICNAYGSFCHHIGVSVFMSLISAIALLLLVWLSFYTLSKKIVRR